ncbi:MAG: universal stress protein [Ardenticatenales bacterium]
MASSPLRTILVATTLGPESDHVVAAAASLARSSGARLHIVHAMLLPLEYGRSAGTTGLTTTPGAMPSPDLYAAFETTLRARLDDQVTRLAIPPTTLAAAQIIDGTPWRVVRAHAAAIDADLIVVGATDKPDLADRLLGSTSTHVVAGADRPVLVLRGHPAMPPKRVLAPVDLSPLSSSAFGTIRALVAAASGGATGGATNTPSDTPPPTSPAATIRALFVLLPLERTASIQFSPEQIDRFAADELDRLVAATGSRAEATSVEAVVRIGQPRDAIEAEAAAWPADLVAIGSHGYSGWDRRLFGSVAGDVVHRGPCSVLVVPATERGVRAG